MSERYESENPDNMVEEHHKEYMRMLFDRYSIIPLFNIYIYVYIDLKICIIEN
jgi:hypothetical protein